MERFIKTPNLPQGNVSLAAVDGRINSEIEKQFNKLNIRLIKTEKIDTYDAISYHPDIMLHHIGEDKIVVPPNIPNKLYYELEKEGFKLIIGKKAVGYQYPDDVAYNVARIGKWAVCNKRFTDEILLDELVKSEIDIIDVKQGYSKCSIAIIAQNSVITSDKGIAKKMVQNLLDVLLIQAGFIELKGLNHGFIGGACGFVSQDKLAFYGNLRFHPDESNIRRFMSKYGIYCLELSETNLIDYGTIIPLKEYSILK
ncbi:hypothetical protein ABG79_00674 [Caloramator mitchellensis]|uniref:DUF6873 domain-containing protein n=1 Tax=Caloramator mitchellensis TaxID=908809 RepID=A0A0R3JUY4_CALMK|nr:hypothetical protein [Caloramator mitchellensis]KRQ87336.1 hypothetical protein ABG79_00674 [Caloramator mitchellensis]